MLLLSLTSVPVRIDYPVAGLAASAAFRPSLNHPPLQQRDFDTSELQNRQRPLGSLHIGDGDDDIGIMDLSMHVPLYLSPTALLIHCLPAREERQQQRDLRLRGAQYDSIIKTYPSSYD
jgi:hypothetical protein